MMDVREPPPGPGLASPGPHTRSDEGFGETIGDVIRSTAARAPDRAAILTPCDPGLTYGGLADLLDRIQAQLNGLGFGRGDRICIALEGRAQVAAAYLAVTSCAVAAPIDPAGSEEEFASVIAALRLDAVLAPPGGAAGARAAAARAGMPVFDAAPAPGTGIGGLALAVSAAALRTGRPGPAQPGDFARAMRTSGTTGEAKVVANRHGHVVHWARHFSAWAGFSADDRLLHVQSPYHGSGTDTSLIPMLTAGGAVALPRSPGLEDVLAAFEAFEPTYFGGNPAFYATLLDHLRRHGVPQGFRRLRMMFSSSAALPAAVMTGIEEITGVALIQRYSSTETAGIICANPVPPRRRKPGTVGFPFHRRIRLIDHAGHDVPCGEVGEILVEHFGTFEGYENDPDGNRDVFLDGWLRSGDLGRFDADGYLTLVGRRRDSINRGGQTIIPAEIDSALLEDPAVRDAVTFPVPHPTLGEIVGAAVVLYDGAAATPDTLLTRLRTRLMPNKVPSHLVLADALPRQANGKIARRSLARHFGLDEAAARPAPPLPRDRAPTPIEAALIGLWKANLGLDRMGPDDDLFRLGGDSLKAAQILAAVDTVFGVRIELAGALADGFTVAALARRIEAARAAAGSNAARPAGEAAPLPQPRQAGATRFPLSFGQERLWFIERMAPDAAAYNEAQAYRMRGALDLDALAAAFQGLVDRHETLRTAFGSDDGIPYQEVLPAVSARLQVHDLSSLDSRERDAAAARLWTEAMLVPFDLGRPPLLRLVVLRLGPHEHMLFRVIHHIVSDAWSNGVLRRELSALYRAARAGVPPALPPLAIQYADHAVWQRARAGGDALAASLDYWSDRLAGAPTVLALPADRLRPAIPSHDGGMIVASLPAGLVARLERCAAAEQATLFMVLLAAFQVLLYRCSGQSDIVTGTPIAGRDSVEAEGLIGFFVNTLALRADLSDAPTFRQHLARVRQTVLDAFRHQAAPFERVVDRLHLERARNVSPLVQVLFAFQNVPQSGWDLDGIDVERIELERERAKVDLTITITQEDGGARMALTFATDLFEHATIEALAAGYRLVLEQVVTDLDRPVDTLPHAAAAEVPPPAIAWPSETIHDRFAAVASSRADAVAVVDDSQSLTYRALDRAAARLAARLAAAGVRPGDRVGVLARRSAGFVVAVLAVVKSGAAYVPLDPEQPPARLTAILEDAGIAVVLATLALAARVDGGPATILIDDGADSDAPPPDVPVPPADADDPVYVIYTSGSTGRPKGVVAAQRGVMRLVVDTTYVRFAPADTVAHLSNVAFDAATFEIWGALLNGARLAVAAPEAVVDPTALARWLAEMRIDKMFITSALFSRMAEAAPGCFRGVGQLLVGGDRVAPAAARAVLRDGAPRRLLNGYGPTETTTFALTHEIATVDPAARSVPIGRPIDGTTVRICDATGAEVPPLVLGEIVIGGPGVALGYHGNPALTAARFVPDPDAPGRRLYLTGDLARRLPDGTIDFLGRRDRQVKVRGFRVEPAEIEAALRDVAGVAEAHVVARARDGEAELIGYVVPRDAAAADVAAVRTALQRALPAYMVPRAIVSVPALPLTPNGKIDEKRLPDPGAAARPAPLLRAPRDTEEAAIAAVWRDVLGRDDIGIDDSFFDLGGHSLLAARLFARLDAALGRQLPISILFESPTIEALAQAYRRAAAAPETGPFRALVPIQPKGSRPPVFAVPGLGGNVIGFAEVARILGEEQPFYGLQSIGLDGSERPLETIEAIAARFVEEIRAVQPHGPYRLLGACLGAAVTLEMAHQLFAAGERIAFLGFLDPSGLAGRRRGQRGVALPPAVRDHLALPRFAAARIGHYWRTLRALEPRDQVAFVADRLRLLGEIVRERDLFRGDRRELNQRLVEEANLRALYGYEPRPFPGAIHILASTRGEDPQRRRGERFDWTRIGADGCTVVRLHSHDSGSAVAPPFVAETTAALAGWLASVE